MDETQSKRGELLLASVLFAFQTIERRYQRICALFLECPENPKDDEVIATTWDFIDWVERLRKLLGYGAGLKKKEQWYKTLVAELGPIEHLRNFTQHMDGSLSECINSKTPLQGIVSAYCQFEGMKGYTVVICAPSTHSGGDQINRSSCASKRCERHQAIITLN
jgi:hypothetical protein